MCHIGNQHLSLGELTATSTYSTTRCTCAAYKATSCFTQPWRDRLVALISRCSRLPGRCTLARVTVEVITTAASPAVSARAVAPPPAPKTSKPKEGTSSAKQSATVNTNSTSGFTSDAAKVSPKDAPLPSLFPEVPNVSPNAPKLRVAVIGAGLAGLSTAVELLEQGYQVDIYDQRPHVGGKVASWRDKDGNHIEMGLHVFFGCYFNLFRLMAKAGALENLLLKDHAHTFVNEGGDVRLLDFRAEFGDFKLGAPFHGLKVHLPSRSLCSVGPSLAFGSF